MRGFSLTDLPTGLPQYARQNKLRPISPSHHAIRYRLGHGKTSVPLNSWRSNGPIHTAEAEPSDEPFNSLAREAAARNNAARTSIPVEVCRLETLPTESSLKDAAAALEHAVQVAQVKFANYKSGLIRLEVPVPRSIDALNWLRGQPSACDTPPLLEPRVYFSPRRSSAPNTEGSTAAGAAAAGSGSVAGAGSAWMWKGVSGQPLNDSAMASIRRFLEADSPRVRVFGGSRFDPGTIPAPEWEEFGSFYFVLPRLELLELSGCSVMACSIAWDEDYSPSDNAESCIVGVGYSSLKEAAAAATDALRSAKDPAPPQASASRLMHVSMQHTPEEREWATRLESVHSQLVPAAPSPSSRHDPEATTEGAAYGSVVKLSPDAALEEYLRNGQQGLDELLAALDSGFEALVARSGSDSDGETDEISQTSTSKSNCVDTGKKSKTGMSKVVLARRTDLQLQGHLDPLSLLGALQERDPRAYQILLQLPSGTTFLASTPECLYTRSGSDVASEAVAGTRARGPGGDVEKDFWLAFDLLRSHKDDVEFGVVRDWVRRALGGVCEDVRVEVTKSVLKQGSVQHLYAKLAGRLREGVDDAALLEALHPTPAVCGQPRGEALRMLSETEPFDRGMYSGPFGWVSRDAAEFVVAIRSALVRSSLSETQKEHLANGNGAMSLASFSPSNSNGASRQLLSNNKQFDRHDVSLFAGVGIVRGSDTASEWAELNLKVSQFERLLAPAPRFTDAPNMPALWARVMVEELCRLGCNTFCVAPGSRSSPLTAAIASHPRARIVPCIDERSLGFWALGYGRACGRPAVVVTSSGTAVANLLPAVVEASQSNVPLLLLTADRPFEMRETGANQTIDQVKIFGNYTRWDCDIEAPYDDTAAKTAVQTIDEAVQATCATPSGPVHLNCQFREPLAPQKQSFNHSTCMNGLETWETSDRTLEECVAAPQFNNNGAATPLDPTLQQLLATVRGARRGLLVIGELVDPEDVAAAVQIAQLLGWPVAADVLSGLRVGARPPQGPPFNLISHFDHLLLDPMHWEYFKPDVVLQLGGHLVSKRVAQFLEWCAAPTDGAKPTPWLFVSRAPLRQDQGPLVTLRFKSSVPALLAALENESTSESTSRQGVARSAALQQSQYSQVLTALDRDASAAVDSALAQFLELTEPAVARVLSQELPLGEGLFIGNSMPIRDLDMYGIPAAVPSQSGTMMFDTSLVEFQGVVHSGLGAPVAANRGASGIDGVLSTAAGFADGLQRGTTLVVGDISFLHDVNGLNLLRSGDMRPPLTVVLVNNSGGGIFSFLPIADHLPDDVFTPLWATPQNVDLAGMCRAHGIPHVRVSSPEELRTALKSAWGLNRHSVIEAITDRGSNVDNHRQVQATVKEAIRATVTQRMITHVEAFPARVARHIITATCKRFQLPMKRPMTVQQPSMGSAVPPREGIFIILDVHTALESTSTTRVAGEVSPLPGLHKETLEEAEAQAEFMSGLLSGAMLPNDAKQFDSWLRGSLGVDPRELLPSVRFGVEGAVLSAMAAARQMPLAQVLSNGMRSITRLGDIVAVNAMMDPQGDLIVAREQARALQARTQPTCIKIKVGRVKNPLDDAAAVLAVRDIVGSDVLLRVDANRAWSMEEAVAFGGAVQSAGLQYIEEPLKDPTADTIAQFYSETGIPVALDESIDEGLFGFFLEDGYWSTATDLEPLPSGIAAVVLKPSVLGGFLQASRLAKIARSRGASVIFSSAFESPLGLLQLAHLAAVEDPEGTMHHGLGTGEWLDLSAQPADIAAKIQDMVRPPSNEQPFSHIQLDGLADMATANRPTVLDMDTSLGLESTKNASNVHVTTSLGTYNLQFIDITPAVVSKKPPVVFLHGFLGHPEEWAPFMRAFAAAGHRCVALNLPGHGSTVDAKEQGAYSLEATAEAVAAALGILNVERCTVVGYSLGARLALLLAAKWPAVVARVAAVSGSPGIEDPDMRAERAKVDTAGADSLRWMGVSKYMDSWYDTPMWATLTAREPLFSIILKRRKRRLECCNGPLSQALEGMSPGRAPAVSKDLCALAAAGELPDLLLVAGEADTKFVKINEELEERIRIAQQAQHGVASTIKTVVVPDCGHTVHIERPVALLQILQSFI